MRTFGLIFMIMSLTACKSTDRKKPMELTHIALENGCPEEGDCALKILRNQRIKFVKEEPTGSIRPKFKTDSAVNVIKFKMDEDKEKTAVDAQYREEVYFEWPKLESTMDLENQELEKVNFLFARFGFKDKDSVGYFKVNSGHLKIKDGKLSFKFDNGQVPQKIKEITAKYDNN